MLTMLRSDQATAMRAAGRRLVSEGVLYVGAVSIALVIMAITIKIIGADPVLGLKTIIEVSLGNEIGLAQTLNKWTPLLLGGLAFMLGARGGVFNIGIDGQIYIGAICAAGAAFGLSGSSVPAGVAVPVVLVAGALGGGLYAGVAGALKGIFGVNEIFVTVMSNFIAMYFTQYMTTGPWNDAMTGEAITVPIPVSAFLPRLMTRGNAHVGILIALVLMVGIYLLLEKTTLGYTIKATGDNPRAAIAGGINYRVVVFLTLSLTGVLAGLAGAIEVSGVHHRLIYGLSPNYMAMSILIAAVAKNHPFGVCLTSFFFAVLLVGSDSLQRSIGLPASAILVFQAIVFLVILLARSFSESR